MPKLSDFLDSPFEVADRVAFGARLLDEIWPDWLDKINLDSLDMSHGLLCVGGQLQQSIDPRDGCYLFFRTRTASLIGGAMTGDLETSSAFMDACGFTIVDIWDESHLHQEWESLTDAWREEITSRRDRDVIISRNSRHEFREAVAGLLKCQGQLTHVGGDREVSSQVIANLRDTTSALLTTIGHMQADLDKAR